MLGETGLYVTLDEHPDHVKKNLQSYDWDIDGMEKKGKLLFVDASGLRRTGGESNRLSPYGGSATDVSDFTELLKTINKVWKAKTFVASPWTQSLLSCFATWRS